jgi:hypothetical protein
MVQAPPNAVVGAPAMNASAAAAAHQPLGPARVKAMPPNANYAVRYGLETTTEKKRQLFRFVKVNQQRERKKRNTRNRLRAIYAHGQLDCGTAIDLFKEIGRIDWAGFGASSMLAPERSF